jgi:hypothetical protein
VSTRRLFAHRWLRLAAGLLALALALAGPATAQTAEAPSASPGESGRRVALVIGNNAYDSAPLLNSVNDARAMAEALRAAGFTVLLHTDVDQRQMQLALREFGDRLKLSAGTGLFYYAGHGMQIKGRNYLIPVRSHIEHEDEVAYSALDAQAVLDKMESAGNGTNIVILDACRNNPFARSFRSAQQGLAQMDAPVGTLVAFATAPGAVAIDSQAGLRNGLYTTHLLDALRRPGLKVEDVFKLVRQGVLRASGNKQMPWEASALVGDFYFLPPAAGAGPAALAAAPPAPPAPAIDPQAAIDDALWAAVKDSRSSAELFAYLNRYPNGKHAREARRRLLDLAGPGAAPAQAATFAPGGGGAAVAAAASETERAAGLRVEEVTRWGQLGTDRRPADPKRNAHGFAEGDRYRYVKTDFFGSGGVTHYMWNVDRIEEDGSLWVNGGRQRLDPRGQRRGGNDEHSGVWLDFAPPLPLAEAVARGAGHQFPFSTVVTVRDADGSIERITFSGNVKVEADAIRGPRGTVDLLPALRVQIGLFGPASRSDGMRRQAQWQHTYWMAQSLLLPVAFEVIEIVDDIPRQRTRHEMVAVDQLSLALSGPTLGR